MLSQEREYQDYEQFASRLVGDPAEDLASVFRCVRPQARPQTQRQWAMRSETREFCTLGLHLLYRRHFHDDGIPATRRQGLMLPNLRPEDLVQHAAAVIRDPDDAAALSRQRWTDTWGYQSNYIEDLVAYLFRPGPYIVRTQESQLVLTKMLSSGMLLGAFVRAGVQAEIDFNLNDPLAALQMFVETALPTDRGIRQHAQRLDTTFIDLWTRLYARVFPAYGLRLRDGIEWRDLGTTFTAVAHGVLARTRVRADERPERLSNGHDVLSTVIIGMLPTLFDIGPHEIETRTLQEAVVDELA